MTGSIGAIGPPAPPSLTEFRAWCRWVSLLNPCASCRAAQVPDAPTSPRPLRDTLLAGLLGLLLGLLAAFIRSTLDQRFQSAQQVQESLELPLMGQIRVEALGLPRVRETGEGVAPQDLEAMRIIRTNLELMSVADPIKSVVVTSPLPEEGKSTAAAALAFASALAGRHTLLLEADLRRPALAQRLGIAQGPGLADYLSGGTPEIIQPVLVPKEVAASESRLDQVEAAPLTCITAGVARPGSAELLGSSRCSRLLRRLHDEYEFIVIDCPPLLPVVDTLELLRLADSALLCIRASQTTRNQARAATTALAQLPPRPVGLVVTGVRHGRDDDYGYYPYGYGNEEAGRRLWQRAGR